MRPTCVGQAAGTYVPPKPVLANPSMTVSLVPLSPDELATDKASLLFAQLSAIHRRLIMLSDRLASSQPPAVPQPDQVEQSMLLHPALDSSYSICNLISDEIAIIERRL